MANANDWVDVPVKEHDDWVDVVEPSTAEKLAGPGQAGLEHFGDAASLGYLPQLQAAAEPVMTKALDLITGQDVSKDLPDYVSRRDENKKRLTQQEKDHPLASTAGTVGGTLASAIPAGAGLSKLPGLSKLALASAPEGAGLAARAAALGKRTAASAGAAGLQGLVSNPGDTEGEVDPLQLGDRAKQGVLGATVAAPLHLVGEGVSSVGKMIADRMKTKANQLAFRALGPFKRQANQNRDQIEEIGREALDSGVVRWAPGSAATIEQRAEDAASTTGKQLGDLTDELSKLESGATSSGMTRKQVADNLRKKLMTENPASIPGIAQKNAHFEGMVQDFEKDPIIRALSEKNDISYGEAMKFAMKNGYKPKPLSFSDLRQAKMAVQGTEGKDGLINWNRLKNADIPIDEQFHRALASELRSGEEAGADAIEKAYYGQSSNRIKNLKDQFGNRSKAAQIAGNKADAQRANQILGLKDAIYGSAGASLGGTIGYEMDGYEGAKTGASLGGAIGAIGNKLARDYGAQVSAKSIDSLSKLMAKSPMVKTILEKNPTLIPQLLENFEKQNRGAQ